MAVIHSAKYDILEMMDLPSDVQDESCDDCPANDSGCIINPEYRPLLKQWLENNGHDATVCYIGWWSW